MTIAERLTESSKVTLQPSLETPKWVVDPILLVVPIVNLILNCNCQHLITVIIIKILLSPITHNNHFLTFPLEPQPNISQHSLGQNNKGKRGRE